MIELKKNRKHMMLALKLLVSALLLVLLYRNTPLQQIAAVLAQSKFVFLLLVGGIILINIGLSALKWRVLLLSDQIDIPLGKLAVSYMIGGFFNLFLPSNIGGDSYRIYDVMRQSGQGARTAASVFADRFSGFIALTIFSLAASAFVAMRVDQPYLILLPLVVFACLTLALYLLWLKTPVLWLLRVTRLDRFPRLIGFCEKFFSALGHYGSETGTLVKVMLLSFAFQFFLIVSVYLMALAINATVPFVYFLAFVPLITLMEAIPISIYGIGVRDMGYVFFFQYAGMGEAYTRSLAIVFLAVTICYSMLGGLLYLGRKVVVSHAGPPPDDTAS